MTGTPVDEIIATLPTNNLWFSMPNGASSLEIRKAAVRLSESFRKGVSLLPVSFGG